MPQILLKGPTLKGDIGDKSPHPSLQQSHLAEKRSIHWDGVKQTGTPWMDGLLGITQCPIYPG